MALTVEQEKQVVEFWNRAPDNPPGLKEITREIFGGDFDGRSEQGRAVKAALAKFGIKAQSTTEYIPKTPEIQLTEEQRLFITNNAATMNSLEMAKMIFKNGNLTNLNSETRVVNDFVKSLDTTVVFGAAQNEDVPEGEYEPPNSLERVLKRVNKYVNFILDKEKLNQNQKKSLTMLINYLHTHRFMRQMNTFDSVKDRETCEDAFIRYTYDKPDLTQEEVDQYIELANQVVQGFKIMRRSEQMQNRLETVTGVDSETMKVSMGLVEAIGKASTEYDQCIKRQQKLLDDLKEKRSSRLSKQIKDSASILNLVTDWRQEEYRVKMLKLGELEQKAVSEEVDKLTTLPEIKARILGLSKDLILYG
jgi:hypothetical protein